MQTKKYIYKDDIKRKKRYTYRAFSSREKKKKKEERASEEEEEHAAIDLYMKFYQSLSSLNFYLSIFLKTEFLFGKTNKVRFHEKFLTPYMKLEVLQIKQINKVFDFTTLNQIYGILHSSTIWSP